MATKITFTLLGLFCGIVISQFFELSKNNSKELDLKNKQSLPAKKLSGWAEIRHLAGERSWQKMGTDNRHELVRKIIDAFENDLIYEGMDYSNLSDKFGSSVEEMTFRDSKIRYIPLGYTTDSLPDTMSHAGPGRQWNLVFVMQGQRVYEIQLWYGNPKLWRLFYGQNRD